MEIKFTDGFYKSLKKMINRNRWYWKAWDFIRYDVPAGISNLIYFFPVIWHFRKWDYNFQLGVFKHSLVPLRDELIDGNEVESSRLKKVAKITRAIEILDNIENDRYISLAEKTLGHEVNSSHLFTKDEPEEITKRNREIFAESTRLEESEWDELFEILKGQDRDEYTLARKEGDVKWDEWFNGSGLRGWWD